MVSVPNPGVPHSTEAPGSGDSVIKPIINVTRERVRRPLLAPDVELVGRVQDSAFDEEQWLICFEDSNYIQATPLLYHVLLFADGTRTVDEIAEAIAGVLSIEITGEDVDWLVKNRLIPSGLLDLGTHDLGEGPRPAELPVLGLRWRIPLLPYKWTVPFANALTFLYWPPLMVAVVLAAIGINVWLFIDASVIQSAQAVMFRPELILLLFVLDTVSTLFHEFGHASALRRAGARYGWIGAALYVIFPVFYTDVTHVYRLSRRDKIRVDLGGMYFELVLTIVFFALYHATGNGIFLIAIVLTTLSFLQQFTPFMRFDGYYTVADIIGVNEPLSIVKPFLRDQIPWPRGREKSLPNLRTGPRIALWAYFLAIVAFLSYPLFIGAFAGRQFAETLYLSGRFLWDQAVASWSQGEILWGIVATLQLFLWALIPLGLTLFAMTLIRHFGHAGFALGRAVVRRALPEIVTRRGLRAGWVTVLVLLTILLLGAGTVVSMNISLSWIGLGQRSASDPVESTAAPAGKPSTQTVASDFEHHWDSDLDFGSTKAPVSADRDQTSNTEAPPAARDAQNAARESVPQSGEMPTETGETHSWLFSEELDGTPGNPPVEPVPDAEHATGPKEMTHVVEPGENLWMIAERYDKTVQELVELNNITNPDLIFTGQTVQLAR